MVRMCVCASSESGCLTARGGPDADRRIGRSVGGEQHVLGQLDHDAQRVEAAQEVLARVPEGGRRIGELRQRAARRTPVGDDAEELLEVDEERIIEQSGVQLDPR